MRRLLDRYAGQGVALYVERGVYKYLDVGIGNAEQNDPPLDTGPLDTAEGSENHEEETHDAANVKALVCPQPPSNREREEHLATGHAQH